jgi:cytochrome c551/c552
MNSISRFVSGLALAGGALLLATQATSAPNTIKLLPETAKLRPSQLPGYAIAMQKCAICHSADYVNYQPPGMTQPQWTAEMVKMQHAYGAPLSDGEVKQIGAYLAVAYGTSKATDDSVIAASAPPAPAAVLPTDTTAPSTPAGAAPAGVGPAIDVQALLNTNACLSCHAIAQKIVGPAYHDVAVKYKGDAQALAKLEASIRQGGVGKWGQVPMPPFAGLSDAQVKALAEFVFKQ